MNSKKKKKDPAAQQLIDSLLDERTPAPRLERDVTKSLQLEEESHLTLSFSSSRVVPTFTEPGGDDKNDDKNEVSEVTATAPGAGHRDESNVSFELVKPPVADDKTMHLSAKKTKPPTASAEPTHTKNAEYPDGERSAIDRQGLTELKSIVKMRDRGAGTIKSSTAQSGGGGPAFTSPEASLKQSENLRIAQSHITDLEHELERIRRENEQLGSAGETLRRRSDELLSKVENFEIQQKELERIHAEEKKVYRGQLQAKDRENGEMRGRLEEMENRLESNFKKIRVRERELEHRLEIVRMESQTLVATKDKMLLELKRQIDQITLEGDYAKQKSQEMFNQYKDKQETIRRVVRALRIALTILEGDEDAVGAKKAE